MDRFVTKKSKIVDKENLEGSTTVENNCEEGSTTIEDNSENEVKQQSKRKFRLEWLSAFPWLEKKDNSAFCKACNKAIVNNLTHLKRHESVSSHVQNMELKRSQASIDNFLQAENDKIENMVRAAELTLVMFLITHNLPFLLMNHLPNLLAECCPDSKVAKHLKCARTKSTQITEFIANIKSKELISDLRSKKFSVIVDETTDVSFKKCIVLVVRYVANSRVCDRFLTLLELTKCDADSIFNVIKLFFEENNIPFRNIIGLATDGASVMAGHLTGLKTFFESETDIFYLKCTCHSLHLCSSYACKKLPENIDWLCRKIYSFFSHSPKRINEFKEFQEYCSVKPHKILGISQTRWLSLEGVVSRIIEQWDSLKLFFIHCKLEVNATKSSKLAENMCDKSKLFFLFLSYVLPLINNLNKDFQSEKSRLPYLYYNIKAHFLLILSNFIKSDIQISVDIDYKNKSNHKEISKIFVGTKAELFFAKINATTEEISEVKTIILDFYIELLDQIKIRFNFNRKDLELLKMITPNEVLSKNNYSIFDLIMHFSNLCNIDDSDKIVMQWNLLKLNDNLKYDEDIDHFWEKISLIKNGLDELMYPDLINFIFKLLSLPHSSATAERKFSSLSLIKTKLRNKLEIKTINNILVCKEVVQNNNDIHYVWSAKKELKF